LSSTKQEVGLDGDTVGPDYVSKLNYDIKPRTIVVLFLRGFTLFTDSGVWHVRSSLRNVFSWHAINLRKVMHIKAHRTVKEQFIEGEGRINCQDGIKLLSNH